MKMKIETTVTANSYLATISYYYKKAINLFSKYHFGFNNQKNHFQAIIVNAH